MISIFCAVCMHESQYEADFEAGIKEILVSATSATASHCEMECFTLTCSLYPCTLSTSHRTPSWTQKAHYLSTVCSLADNRTLSLDLPCLEYTSRMLCWPHVVWPQTSGCVSTIIRSRQPPISPSNSPESAILPALSSVPYQGLGPRAETPSSAQLHMLSLTEPHLKERDAIPIANRFPPCPSQSVPCALRHCSASASKQFCTVNVLSMWRASVPSPSSIHTFHPLHASPTSLARRWQPKRLSTQPAGTIGASHAAGAAVQSSQPPSAQPRCLHLVRIHSGSGRAPEQLSRFAKTLAP